jgi:hypothetical protein
MSGWLIGNRRDYTLLYTETADFTELHGFIKKSVFVRRRIREIRVPNRGNSQRV